MHTYKLGFYFLLFPDLLDWTIMAAAERVVKG